jgi:putative spermidine/putrescine transport system ATP-binding protein
MGRSLEPNLNEAGDLSHVSVARLSKRYDAATVLDAIDMDVTRGALVTLLGPSGCGKTTLLRLIAGLASPDEGSVSIAGRDVTRTAPHKRNVGVVFQNYALFPHLTVAGNVGFGLSGRGLSKAEFGAKLSEALALVQLVQLKDRPIAALSGGQQQRVALARALAVKPQVLLFDEALSALDRSLRETMQVELRSLLKDLEATAIFVTHDQDEALTMSDKIAVMNAGRIEQYADPLNVYLRPQTLFTMRFIGVSSELRGVVACQWDGQVKVDTPIGAVVAEGRQPVGASVVVATRPEQIQLANAPNDAYNQIEGCIRRITFHGSRTRVAVDVGTNSDFFVDIGAVDTLPHVGDLTELSWPRAQSFTFVDPEAAR